MEEKKYIKSAIESAVNNYNRGYKDGQFTLNFFDTSIYSVDPKYISCTFNYNRGENSYRETFKLHIDRNASYYEVKDNALIVMISFANDVRCNNKRHRDYYINSNHDDFDLISLWLQNNLSEASSNQLPRENSKLEIKKVIFNYPATIVLWEDGTKTVVKCDEDEEFDYEKGLAMAISKKALGNKGNYYNVFKKCIDEDEDGLDNNDPKLNDIQLLIGKTFANAIKAVTGK